MPPRPTRGNEPRHLRAAARQQLGPLHRHRVSAKTYARYLHAAQQFTTWVTASGMPLAVSLDELDAQACRYLEQLWAHGEGRNLAGDTLSAVQHFLHKRRILTAAWGLFSAWGRLEVPDRAPPLPLQVLYAFCGLALSERKPALSAALALGFHCLLRTSELLTMRWCQVTLGADHRGVVTLPWTNQGRGAGLRRWAPWMMSAWGASYAA